MNHEETNVTANPKYKDTMFRMLFKDKRELLSLYNAVTECIKNNILADFLRQNRAEAISMSIFEYDEELLKKTEYNFGKKEGIRDGIKTGMKLVDALLKAGRNEDIPKVMEDSAYCEKLLHEYNILPDYF